MKHLSEVELSALADGALRGGTREKAERHVNQCPRCRAALDGLMARDRLLGSTLTRDPGAEYFESFASRVAERIQAASQLEPATRSFLAGWSWKPRSLAWSGALAALVAGAGIVFLVSRETPVPDLRDRGVATVPGPAEQSESDAAPPSSRVQPPPQPGTPQSSTLRSNQATRDVRTRTRVTRPSAPAAGAQKAAEEAEVVQGKQEGKPLASTGRMVEVRRTEHGEEVPVRPQMDFPLPPPAVSGSPSSRFVKPGAEPLAGSSQMDRTPKTGGAELKSFAGESRPSAQESRSNVLREPAGGQRAFSRDDGGSAWICGSISDHRGRPVPGAQVVLAELNRAVTSDAQGRYCIEAPLGERMLTVLAVGFERRQRHVHFGSAPGNADITLEAVSVLDAPLKISPDPDRMSTRAGRAQSAPLRIEPFSGWPSNARELARRAESASRDAERVESAARFENAAVEWERVLAQLRGGEPEREARRNLAEARYRAWEIRPTPPRAVAAMQALSAYLRVAPAGPSREQTLRRIERLKP
jgi:hypothetical protein